MRGDASAMVAVRLELFVRDHALELMRFAYLITGDRGRSEDLVQDALLSMYRRFGEVVAVEDPLSYARRCVVNAQISQQRRRRVVELLSGEPLDALSGCSEELDHADDDELWGVLTGLPARQRAVLVLRYYLSESDRDIASVLGCRESSVRSLAARAFKSLRPVLRPTSPTNSQVTP